MQKNNWDGWLFFVIKFAWYKWLFYDIGTGSSLDTLILDCLIGPSILLIVQFSRSSHLPTVWKILLFLFCLILCVLLFNQSSFFLETRIIWV